MNTTIDIDQLTSDITKDSPTGVCLRFNEETMSLYYEIKDTRNKARNIERKNLSGEDDSNPYPLWEKVSILGEQALIEKTKDLEIAAWLTEAWLRLYAFDGLKSGFSLIHTLLKKYKDSIYPLADEDGVETTLACLVGLNGDGNDGSLISPIRNQLITQGQSQGPFTLWQYQQAITLDKVKNPVTKQEKISAGAIDLSMIRAAVKETPLSFYQGLQQSLNDALDVFNDLQQFLTEIYADKAPPSSTIKSNLLSFDEHLKFIFNEVDMPIQTIVQSNEEVQDETQPEQHVVKNAPPIVKDRENALNILASIAQFFKETEPHSPLSYSIDRLVRWGGMSLPDLMQELIMDEKAKTEFLNLTGLPHLKQK